MGKLFRGEEITLARADRIVLYALAAVGAAIALLAVVGASIRTTAILGGPIDVDVSFLSVPVDLQMGTSSLAVQMNSGAVRVDQVSGAAAGFLIAAAITGALCTVTFVLSLLIIARNLLRATPFCRSSTVAAVLALLAGILTTMLIPNLQMLGSAWAVTDTVDTTFSGIAIGGIAIEAIILTVFAGVLLVVVFSIGDRLQRDTQGLV